MSDVEKVVQQLEDFARFLSENGFGGSSVILSAIALLKAQESRWISEGHKKDRFCERCGHDEPYKNAGEETKIFNYCPHCGARMIN